MAHNLNFNEITGKYSFYSLKEKAWHSYGQISDKQLNSREVLMQSQLAFPVKMLPNVFRLPSGKEIIEPIIDFKCIMVFEFSYCLN